MLLGLGNLIVKIFKIVPAALTEYICNIINVPGVVDEACKAAFPGGIQDFSTIQGHNVCFLQTCKMFSPSYHHGKIPNVQFV